MYYNDNQHRRCNSDADYGCDVFRTGLDENDVEPEKVLVLELSDFNTHDELERTRIHEKSSVFLLVNYYIMRVLEEINKINIISNDKWDVDRGFYLYGDNSKVIIQE